MPFGMAMMEFELSLWRILSFKAVVLCRSERLEADARGAVEKYADTAGYCGEGEKLSVACGWDCSWL